MYLYTYFQGFVYLKQGPKINTAKFSVMTKLIDEWLFCYTLSFSVYLKYFTALFFEGKAIQGHCQVLSRMSGWCVCDIRQNTE